jgi:mannose-1-phosphate guanylyltransferase
MENYLAFIMAGGGGTRFWPKSRKKTPKQFLPIVGDSPLISQTVERLCSFAERDNVFIITNEIQKPGTIERVKLQEVNVIAEPFGRNTAPCVGLAAIIAQVKSGDDTVVGIFPADHYITPVEEFDKTVEQAVLLAEKSDSIVTIGIKPSHPATGYGYIQHGDTVDGCKVNSYKVKRFTEKPDIDTAKNFLEGGGYSWNAGMFFFKAGVVLNELKNQQPKIYNLLQEFKNSIGKADEADKLCEVYEKMPSISFDYAIMEHATSVHVVEATFNWDDVGSWAAVSRHEKMDENGNCIKGDAIIVDSKNNTVESEKTVALVGVENLVVVDTGDAILVCSKDNCENVKEVVEILKKEKREELL